MKKKTKKNKKGTETSERFLLMPSNCAQTTAKGTPKKE